MSYVAISYEEIHAHVFFQLLFASEPCPWYYDFEEVYGAS